MAERHDVVGAGGHAREENRGFVGFGAGVGEKTFLQRAGSNLRDFFGEIDDGFGGIERGSVLQAIDLRLDFAGDLGIGVPDGNGENAAEEIEIPAAFEVPNVLHVRAVGDERPLVEIGDSGPDVFAMLAQDFGGAAGSGRGIAGGARGIGCRGRGMFRRGLGVRCWFRHDVCSMCDGVKRPVPMEFDCAPESAGFSRIGWLENSIYPHPYVFS